MQMPSQMDSEGLWVDLKGPNLIQLCIHKIKCTVFIGV